MDHKCEGCRYKSFHQEMMFKPFGVCARTTNLMEAEKNYNAEKCPYKKTNADRIRAMSDEKLANFLCGISTAECCDRSCQARDICGFEDNGMIKWLKQPAEDG